jgi:hypothetical protein
MRLTGGTPVAVLCHGPRNPLQVEGEPLDRRRHHRYAASARAEVQVLRDVEIESASPSLLSVLTDMPTAAGLDAAIRVTGSDQVQVTLRVKATHCHPVIIAGRRRFRVIYSVLGSESRTVA